MTTDGIPKLTDFGLAKAESADTGMTMAGAVLGTLDFMPPEQRRDAALTDARSDLWSLAATVYQMVTGKSPKIIKFNDIPKNLQDVLDKALQDSKDDRYQSAREFKEALRSNLNAAKRPAPQPTTDLGAGECPSCHSVNESHRKFCRECGDPLRCKCLKCEHEIPVWDKVCPECGGKQKELAASRLQEIQSQREHAEQQREEHQYQKALDLAQSIAAIDDRRLNQHQSWAMEFIEATKTEWERQKDLATQSFAAAKKHREVFDYDAAILAVGSIPEPLRSSQIKEYLRTITADRDESAALIDTIKSRINERSIDGLVPLVEKAISLRGDRADLRKLLAQLRERELKLDRERDEAFALAGSLLGEGKAKEACQAVQSIDVRRLVGDQPKLRTKLENLFEAEREIAAMVKEANADGVVEPHEALALYPKVNNYLRRNPKHSMMVTLRDDLIGLLEKIPTSKLVKLPYEVLLRLPLSLQKKLNPTITNSIGMKLKLISDGTLKMGEGSDSHPVTLTKPFYLGVYQVTQEEYERVIGTNPSKFKGSRNPVETVSWENAVEFCRKLSSLPEEKIAGSVYRLPTEAEWEYACRAGSTTKYCFGDSDSRLGEYAWFQENSGKQSHGVGQKRPNALGLYDMHGNVWEWCNDWYGEYPRIAVTDPVGPLTGSFRVLRGGSWLRVAARCRSAVRERFVPSTRDNSFGFRVAMTVPDESISSGLHA
jgi:formylglycine-generating enzyme required for sulfatase activity